MFFYSWTSSSTAHCLFTFVLLNSFMAKAMGCLTFVKNQQQNDLNMVDAGKPDPFLYGWAFASFEKLLLLS